MSRLRELLDNPVRRAQIEARFFRPYRVRQFRQFGDRSVVHRPAWIAGAQHMQIGSGVLIFKGAWLAVEQVARHQSEPALIIGDRAGLRPYCTISASERVELEDDVICGAGCSIVDSDHTWRNGRPNVLDNPAAIAPIRIGAGTWLGDGVRVLKGSTIGEQCAIGANSVVRGEIPDGSIAVGVPARVVGLTKNL